MPVRAVLEFGVFKGDSIRWLAEQCPGATIRGCDIVPLQPEWPTSPRIQYRRVDQGSPDELRRLFAMEPHSLDLIIEDGSHVPTHQRNCLVEGIRHVRPGGAYVLEDIHTSHPDHAKYRADRPGAYVGPLQLLLALEHLRAINAPLDDDVVEALCRDSVFVADDVRLIDERLASIAIFKRATLPHRCYRCGRDAFDYAVLRCRCGEPLYAAADSMTAILRVREAPERR
jgi:predicted O-methyltransferase YrrM